MVLGDLGLKLTGALRNLSQAHIVDESVRRASGVATALCGPPAYAPWSVRSKPSLFDLQVLDNLLKEISIALLQADVNVRQVKQLQERIKSSVNLEELASGLNRRRIIEQVRRRDVRRRRSAGTPG